MASPACVWSGGLPSAIFGATLRDRRAHLACTSGLEERSGFELTRLKLIARGMRSAFRALIRSLGQKRAL